MTNQMNPRLMKQSDLEKEIAELERIRNEGDMTASQADRLLELRRALRLIKSTTEWRRYL